MLTSSSFSFCIRILSCRCEQFAAIDNSFCFLSLILPDILPVLCFFSSFMKWIEKHDIFLCWEILFMKPYQFKAGSPQSGNAWKNIASDLCEVKEITFNVNQKSVRDRYRLLLEKHKKKMRAQEGSSGSNTDETELDQLLQNIVEESREASENYETDTKDKHEKGLKAR